MVVILIAVAAMPLEFRILVNASRTCSLAGLILASAVVFGSAAAPVAAQNYAPPPGAIIDLSTKGGSIPSSPTLYKSDPFYINQADVVDGAVPITFAFRDDSFGKLEFWGADLVDVSKPGGNLFQMVDFAGAGLGSTEAPSPWNYTAPADGSGISYSYFSTGCGVGRCWVDATIRGYDQLSQSVVLNKDDQYQISFYVSDPKAQSSWTWSQYSTIDTSLYPFRGNGADILVYLGKVGPYTNIETPPPPTLTAPEPSTWAMMLLGLAGLGFLGYHRASAQASASRT
jgi:hypothetical protein